jgi:hypothetical protein
MEDDGSGRPGVTSFKVDPLAGRSLNRMHVIMEDKTSSYSFQIAHYVISDL